MEDQQRQTCSVFDSPICPFILALIVRLHVENRIPIANDAHKDIGLLQPDKDNKDDNVPILPQHPYPSSELHSTKTQNTNLGQLKIGKSIYDVYTLRCHIDFKIKPLLDHHFKRLTKVALAYACRKVFLQWAIATYRARLRQRDAAKKRVDVCMMKRKKERREALKLELEKSNHIFTAMRKRAWFLLHCFVFHRQRQALRQRFQRWRTFVISLKHQVSNIFYAWRAYVSARVMYRLNLVVFARSLLPLAPLWRKSKRKAAFCKWLEVMEWKKRWVRVKLLFNLWSSWTRSNVESLAEKRKQVLLIVRRCRMTKAWKEWGGVIYRYKKLRVCLYIFLDRKHVLLCRAIRTWKVNTLYISDAYAAQYGKDDSLRDADDDKEVKGEEKMEKEEEGGEGDVDVNVNVNVEEERNKKMIAEEKWEKYRDERSEKKPSSSKSKSALVDNRGRPLTSFAASDVQELSLNISAFPLEDSTTTNKSRGGESHGHDMPSGQNDSPVAIATLSPMTRTPLADISSSSASSSSSSSSKKFSGTPKTPPRHHIKCTCVSCIKAKAAVPGSDGNHRANHRYKSMPSSPATPSTSATATRSRVQTNKRSPMNRHNGQHPSPQPSPYLQADNNSHSQMDDLGSLAYSNSEVDDETVTAVSPLSITQDVATGTQDFAVIADTANANSYASVSISGSGSGSISISAMAAANDDDNADGNYNGNGDYLEMERSDIIEKNKEANNVREDKGEDHKEDHKEEGVD